MMMWSIPSPGNVSTATSTAGPDCGPNVAVTAAVLVRPDGQPGFALADGEATALTRRHQRCVWARGGAVGGSPVTAAPVVSPSQRCRANAGPAAPHRRRRRPNPRAPPANPRATTIRTTPRTSARNDKARTHMGSGYAGVLRQDSGSGGRI